MLEPVIDGIYNIPHNRLHMFILSEGLAIEDEKEKEET